MLVRPLDEIDLTAVMEKKVNCALSQTWAEKTYQYTAKFHAWFNVCRTMLPSVPLSSAINKWHVFFSSGWGRVMSHHRGPPLSPGDRAKGTGHWVAPEESNGKQSIGQNAISSLYHTLMALGTDGQISRRQRHTGDCAFHLCEYLRGYGGPHMCSHSWGERAY